MENSIASSYKIKHAITYELAIALLTQKWKLSLPEKSKLISTENPVHECSWQLYSQKPKTEDSKDIFQWVSG